MGNWRRDKGCRVNLCFFFVFLVYQRIEVVRELSVLLLPVYSPHYSPVSFLVISSFVNERYSSLEMLE